MSLNHIILKKKGLSETEKEDLIQTYTNYKTPQLRSCFEPICVAMKPIEESFLNNEIKYRTGLLDFSQKVGFSSESALHIKGSEFIALGKTPSNVITAEELTSKGFNKEYDKNFLISKPNKKEKGSFNNHITVKPIALMEHLIRIFSKEGSVVLDPFMGSGSTGIACIKNNRKFIGIEKNEEYYRISCLRHLLTKGT